MRKARFPNSPTEHTSVRKESGRVSHIHIATTQNSLDEQETSLSRTRAEVRNAVTHRNSEQISKLLNWLLPDDRLLADLKLHGNTSWLPRTLASLALCWAWAENRCLTDSFTYAAGWTQTLAGDGVVLTT